MSAWTPPLAILALLELALVAAASLDAGGALSPGAPPARGRRVALMRSEGSAASQERPGEASQVAEERSAAKIADESTRTNAAAAEDDAAARRSASRERDAATTEASSAEVELAAGASAAAAADGHAKAEAAARAADAEGGSASMHEVEEHGAEFAKIDVVASAAGEAGSVASVHEGKERGAKAELAVAKAKMAPSMADELVGGAIASTHEERGATAAEAGVARTDTVASAAGKAVGSGSIASTRGVEEPVAKTDAAAGVVSELAKGESRVAEAEASEDSVAKKEVVARVDELNKEGGASAHEAEKNPKQHKGETMVEGAAASGNAMPTRMQGSTAVDCSMPPPLPLSATRSFCSAQMVRRFSACCQQAMWALGGAYEYGGMPELWRTMAEFDEVPHCPGLEQIDGGAWWRRFQFQYDCALRDPILQEWRNRSERLNRLCGAATKEWCNHLM